MKISTHKLLWKQEARDGSPRTKVFFATCFGALIGSFVSLEMFTLSWLVGMLVGGLTGYLSFEFKKVLKACREAWHLVSGWKLDKEKLLFYFWAVGFCLNYILLVLVSLLVDNLLNEVIIWKVNAGLILFISCWMFVTLLITYTIVHDFYRNRSAYCNVKENHYYITFRKYNVIFVMFYHLWRWAYIGIKYTVTHSHIPFIFLGKFVWTVFKLIHSDARLVVGVFSAVGTLISYAYAHPLYGTFIGGLLGLGSYELISKRWLKLVPVKSELK